MDSQKAGVLSVGTVITAVEGARNEAGVLRVRFQHNQHDHDGVISLSGWVSEFAANGQMCLATVPQPHPEPEPEQPPAGIELGAAATCTTPSPVNAAPRALSFQSPALEPGGPPPQLRSPDEDVDASERWSSDLVAPSPAPSLRGNHVMPQIAADVDRSESPVVPPVMPPLATEDSGYTGNEDPPQIPEGLQSLTVTCPEGIYGGDLLMVTTPDGELELEVVVPDGVNPGDLFEGKPRVEMCSGIIQRKTFHSLVWRHAVRFLLLHGPMGLLLSKHLLPYSA